MFDKILDPECKYPMVMPDGTVIREVVNLKAVINHPNIVVGDFSYYHNFEVLDNYAAYIAPYLFPVNPEKLIIGKFCQFAHGVRFITSSANHYLQGFSTYPFQNFMMTAETTMEDVSKMFEQAKQQGDTVVGNDVWMGMNTTILPGVTIGNGAIIGACSVVTRDIPAYSVYGGNPAGKIRMRFSPDIIEKLQNIAWWDWPADIISANFQVIAGADISRMQQISDRLG